MRLEMVLFDLMHIGPLGIFRNLCAAVIIDFLQRGKLRHVNEALALRQLWTEFRQGCSGHHIPPPHGTLARRLLGQSKLTDLPELHSCIKATTVKLLVVFVGR